MVASNQWKSKFNEMVQVCQDELKRTTDIGKRMLSASRTNTTLHESFEELGVILVAALKSGELEWDNPRVAEIMKVIDSCEKDLANIESEVNDIRFSSESEGEAKAASENKEDNKEDSKES